MLPVRDLWHELTGNRRGATVVEFGAVAPVLILMLIGGFDLAHQSYIRSVLQGALSDAARRAAVETPRFGGARDELPNAIEDLIEDQLDPIAPNASVRVVPRTFFDFTGIGSPEELTVDNNGNGTFDEDDEDCFLDQNGNGEYDTDSSSGEQNNVGGANDVVFYEATLEMPRVVPLHGLLGVAPEYRIQAQTAIRNQPWDDQRVPNEECGAS